MLGQGPAPSNSIPLKHRHSGVAPAGVTAQEKACVRRHLERLVFFKFLLAVLGLCYCVQAFSSCCELGLL